MLVAKLETKEYIVCIWQSKFIDNIDNINKILCFIDRNLYVNKRDENFL